MNEPDPLNEPSEAPPEQAAPGGFSDPVEARRKAMDCLARREYGRRELLDKLVRAGFDPETAAAAVGQLGREGLQDDRRYVEALLRSRIGQGKGPVRIRLDLRQRGIDPAVVDEQLEGCGEDWTALARRVRRKRFGPDLPEEYHEKARQMAFLRYRGFEPEQIKSALAPDEVS